MKPAHTVYIGQAGIMIIRGKRKSVVSTGTYIKTFIIEVPKLKLVLYFKGDD